MKKNVGLWQLMGFAVTSFLGTILHFLYEWLDSAVWIAPFSGVNESTWEHMKLLFWPMFMFAIVESFFKNNKAFWFVKLRGIVLGLALIPVIFYTYNGIVGTSPDWVNIAIFFISAAVVYIYETRLFKMNMAKCRSARIALGILLLFAVCFVLFTFITPTLAIFKDPLGGSYGI